jgi:hypothetical protein
VKRINVVKRLEIDIMKTCLENVRTVARYRKNWYENTLKTGADGVKYVQHT